LLPTTLPTVVRSRVAWRLPTDRKVIALTIDAGSDLGFTNSILDTLADRRVQTSFGITGDFARAHPRQVERMAREGHVVMNHSDTHRSFTGTSSSQVLLSTEARQADLCAADGTLAELVGHTTRPYWRPPFGDHDAGVLDDVGAIGYAYTVMWTFDSLGWKGISADQIVDRVLDKAEPGAIIVMHAGSQSQDGPALGRVIDGLRAQGYTFTTVENGLTG
jgi:peptidoglycan/xylan/chitin deacetylase (PgdA/CDA1 family)